MKISYLLLSILLLANPAFVAANEKVGVLLLAHGGKHASWDESVQHATKSLQHNYPVEVAFGMANPTTMQAGINKLELQGVKKIVVVQLFISSFSPIIRQNEYLLGIRSTLADPPMLMMSHSSSTNSTNDTGDSSHSYSYSSHKMGAGHESTELLPLKISAKIILTEPLNSHPLVAEIVYARINELSTAPETETVLLVAHGPSAEDDNKKWVKTIEDLADQVRSLQASKPTKFKQIFALTVRDDADTAIYDQAKEHFRTLVSQSAKDGETIVIPLLLSQGGVEARYVKRLEGLDYKWSGKTLLPHQNITKFIELSVADALNN